MVLLILYDYEIIDHVQILQKRILHSFLLFIVITSIILFDQSIKWVTSSMPRFQSRDIITEGIKVKMETATYKLCWVACNYVTLDKDDVFIYSTHYF